jgi:transposase
MEAQFRNIPDALWNRIAPIIPGRRKNTLRGRPPVPDREVLAGIVYRLRTGC